MGLRVVHYEALHESAVRDFNARMRAADALPFPMPEIAPAPNPSVHIAGIGFQHFVVVDDAQAVRGGYFIRTQPFLIAGQVHDVGHYQAPLSEGIADKRYAAVGGAMLAHALTVQPLLFAMGMGGFDRPLPRMLRAMGWAVMEVPFFFLVLNVRRFLRNTGPLRASAVRRAAADALAFSGLGGMALHGAQLIRGRGALQGSYESTPIADFSDWTDEVWRASAEQYSFSAVRSADYLRFLYAKGDADYYGRRLTASGSEKGWVEMLDCQPRDRSYFGEMHVAALVDGMGVPEAVPSLVRCAIVAAKEREADLLISNQMHRDWRAALKAAGFWQGPSNYLLALSKPLQTLMEPLNETSPLIHFNRGDGDGRVNLTSDSIY